MNENVPVQEKKPKKKKRRIYVWFIITATILALMFAVQVPYYISGYGNIMSEKDAVIRAGVKGPIKSLLVESGQLVKKGDVIIELEDSVQRADVLTNERRLMQAKTELVRLTAQMHYELAKQKSEIELARIKLKDVEREYQRIKKLFTQQAASKTELRKAEIAYELAKTELEEISLDKEKLLQAEIEVQKKKIAVLEASLELAKANLVLRKVHSPISGVVVLHSLSIGQVVDAVQVLGQVFKQNKYQVIAKIPERYLWFSREGKKVIAQTSSYPHRQFGYIGGEIRWVSPVVNPNSSGDGSILIKADIINCPDRIILKPGQSAQIWIDAGRVPLIYYLLGVRRFNEQ